MQIAGVLNESFLYDSGLDGIYWVINANGTFSNVNYRGDDFDNDDRNCYETFRGRVTTFGPDGYVFDTPYPNNPTQLHYLKVIDGDLFELSESGGQPILRFPAVPDGLDSSIPEC